MNFLKEIHSFVFFVVLSSLSTLSLAHPSDTLTTSEFISRAKLRQSEDGFRLTPTVYPVNYKLELMTILDPLPGYDRFTAPAKAWISVHVNESISIFTLHAINLTIVESSVTVRNSNTGTNVRIAGTSFTPAFDFFHIELADSAIAGETYEVYIEFTTPIHSDRLNGMYLDFYDDPDTGERNYIATTLFAPYHARRAFPCFDEPSFRATYDITIGHHTKYHAMSNADILSSRPIDNMTDWVWDTFGPTPSISSYIVAMVVSNLDFYEAPPNSFRNVTVRTYAKPASIQQGAAEYSATTTGRVMTYFESLFIAEYPITKIYSVALPQFFFNAMENWGLITYKEPVLLYIPGETSEDDRYRINYVLSHEKAHQHFGNIVACNWWSWVWLKEGFATYYSHYGINHTNPELNPWEQFVPRVLQVAMEFDSSNETHPLENFPQTSPAVADIYTRIPYEKGASILRMTSSMLTEPVFLTAIRDYVETFKYKSATQYDLFEALQRAVDASPQMSTLIPTSMLDIMNSWTLQAGYPVLNVDVIDATTLRITQEKYIDGDDSNPTDTWWVPVYISPRPNTSLPVGYPDAWIPQNVNEITVSLPTDQLIVINPGAVGYYRVLYNEALLQRILRKLHTNHIQIPTSARSQILNDYFNFAITGQVEIQTSLDLLAYMEKESALSVWQSIAPFIDNIDKLLVNTTHHNAFQAYFGRVILNALTSVEHSLAELEIDKGDQIILRSLLGKLLCKLNHEECVANSKFWVRSWSHSATTAVIPVEIQEEVFCGAARDSRSWLFLLSEYTELTKRGTYSPVSKRMLYGMTCSKNSASLERILNAIIYPDSSFSISQPDKTLALSYLVDNPIGRTVLMRHLQESNSTEWFLQTFHTRDDLRSIMNKLTAYDLSQEEIETFIKIADTASPSFHATILANIQRNRGSLDSAEVLVKIGEWLHNRL